MILGLFFEKYRLALFRLKSGLASIKTCINFIFVWWPMGKIWLSIFGATLLALPISTTAQVSVRGYFRSNGTYVQPHVRSAPNNTTVDNWSTRGNVNPYTGKNGTANPYPYSRLVPSAPSYMPITPSSPPTVPATPEPLTALQKLEGMIVPKTGTHQQQERKNCYTIYDCQ